MSSDIEANRVFRLMSPLSVLLLPHIQTYLEAKKKMLLRRSPVVVASDMSEYLYEELGALMTVLKHNCWNLYHSSKSSQGSSESTEGS